MTESVKSLLRIFKHSLAPGPGNPAYKPFFIVGIKDNHAFVNGLKAGPVIKGQGPRVRVGLPAVRKHDKPACIGFTQGHIPFECF